MKNLSFVSGCIACLSIVSCQNNNGDTPITESLTSTLFIDDECLTKPASLTATENLLVIANTSKCDTLISFFDRNGNNFCNTLGKGKGPMEAMWIDNVQYCSNDKSFFTADIINHKTFKISEEYLISPYLTFGDLTQKVDNNASQYVPTGYFGILNNGYLIASNGSADGMFAILSESGQLKEFIVPFPDKNLTDNKLSEIANIRLYQPQLRISPDGSFAVASYADADMRTFIYLDNEPIKHKKIVDAYPNDLYLIESATDVIQAALTPTSFFYCLSLTVSNKYAYELYCGMTTEQMRELDIVKETTQYATKTVRVFDRDGNLKRMLELDKWVKAIAVTPDDKYLYALGESSADGYYILKYEL